MGNSHRPKSSLVGGIYTLAQSGTNDIRDNINSPDIIVYGNGSDITDKTAWQGRAKRKLITQKLMIALVDVCKLKGELERAQRYWNAYHCQSNLTKSKGRIYGNYCKSRFCLVCLSIRKAEIINKYLATIQTWEDPHFVTLTVKAVPEEKLKKWIKAMKVAFDRMKGRFKQRHRRGKMTKFIGVKSLECNFNPKEKTYNPHYHLIVPNLEIATALMVEWQRVWNTKQKLARPYGQHKRRVNNLEVDLIEVVKYGAKIFTEPDVKKKDKSILPTIYAAAMDNIFCALDGSRLFDRFGFNLPKSAHRKKTKPTFLQNYEEVAFDNVANDWVNHETGELLTGYVPTSQLEFLLNQHIDKDLT